MPMSQYYAGLRGKIGSSLLLIPSVAAVVHDQQGRVLIQEQLDGGFSLPAGAIEPGETPFDAVVREVQEETRLQVLPTDILGVFGGAAYRTTYPNGHEVEYTVILLRCTLCGGHLTAGDETRRAAFFPPDEAPPLAMDYPRHLLSP